MQDWALGSDIKKILLDTDIGYGTDADGALAYLLRQPACELLGIPAAPGLSSTTEPG
jgi:inosine-uridine nucleoside N-ribohydrolase